MENISLLQLAPKLWYLVFGISTYTYDFRNTQPGFRFSMKIRVSVFVVSPCVVLDFKNIMRKRVKLTRIITP